MSRTRAPGERPWWGDLLLAVGLMLLAGAPLVLGRTYFYDDAGGLALPLFASLQRALHAGGTLTWNAELFAGYFGLGAGQSGSYYPPNLVLLKLFPLLVAFRLSYLLHLWLLARGMLGFARSLGYRTAGALVTAAVATLGGAVAAHTMHHNVVIGLAWTGPILWLAVVVVRARDPWRPVLGLSAVLALSLLQSHPQYAFLALLAAVCVAPWARAEGVSPRAAALRLLAAAAIGVLLALAQLVPLYEYARLNRRPQPGGAFEFMTAGSLTLRDLLRLFQPDLFGSPVAGTWADPNGFTYWETRAFFGLLFGALALAQALRRPSDAGSRAGLTLVVVALLLVNGRANPLYHLLVHLPPFSLFRIPARNLWLLQLGVALLAGQGVMAFQQRRLPPRRTWLAAGAVVVVTAAALLAEGTARMGVVAAVGSVVGLVATALLAPAAGLRGARRRRALHALVGVGLLELVVSWHTFAVTRPQSVFATPPRVAQPILLSDNHRVLDLQLSPPPIGLTADLESLVADTGVIWGVSYFGGGREALPPLGSLGAQQQLGRALTGGPARFGRLLSRYSIRWVVTSLTLPGLRPALEWQGVRLYENLGARPLAYALPESAVRDGAVSTAEDESGDWRPVTVLSRGATTWRLATKLDRPSAVVLAQSLYPGWMATIDGEPAPLLPAEGLYLATLVPAGEHVVEFTFDSASAWLGATLSRIAVVAWLAAMIYACTRRRRTATGGRDDGQMGMGDDGPAGGALGVGRGA